MPYIKKEDRKAYDEEVNALIEKLLINGGSAGDLNYCLSRITWEIFDKQGGRYAHANELMGVLSCVQAEFYRRKVAPYEDLKITEAGDIQ